MGLNGFSGFCFLHPTPFLCYIVFGLSEIQEREIEEREVGEKNHTSPVWYVVNLERGRLKKGGTYTFFFSHLRQNPSLPTLHVAKINYGGRRLLFT